MGLHGKSMFGSVNQPLGADAVRGKKRKHCDICDSNYFEGSKRDYHGWDRCRCSNCGAYGNFIMGECRSCGHIAWFWNNKPEPKGLAIDG